VVFREVGAALKPGKLKRYELLGEPVLLGRDRAGGGLRPARHLPPPRRPAVAGQLVTDPQGAPAVACPYHGWTFRTGDGVCSAIPSMTADQAFDSTRIRVRRYPARESQGLVFVYMPSDPRWTGEPESPPPAFEGVVGGQPKLVDSVVFDSHLDHAVVGLMDPAHGPYVHQQWWWRSSTSMHDKRKRSNRALGFSMVRTRRPRTAGPTRCSGGAPETEITFRCRLPLGALHRGSAPGDDLTCLTRWTRADPDHPGCSGRPPALHLAEAAIRAGARRFLKQDGDMVNLQNEGLRYDPACSGSTTRTVRPSGTRRSSASGPTAARRARFDNPVRPPCSVGEAEPQYFTLQPYGLLTGWATGRPARRSLMAAVT
jgi:hypothetical protein